MILPHDSPGRAAKPEEMAGAVLYLVFPMPASYVTGTCIIADGGMLA